MKAFLEPLHSLAEFDEIYKKAKQIRESFRFPDA